MLEYSPKPTNKNMQSSRKMEPLWALRYHDGCPLFQEAGDNSQFCWRNLFSCINLLRLLNKLTKWKHSRTMVSGL